MAQKLTASLPANLYLGAGYTLEFAAVDPTTGNAVSGLKVSNAYLVLAQLTPGGPEALTEATPLWVPVPNELLSSGVGAPA